MLASREPERHGFRRYWQRAAQVPWLYNAERRIWISYDDSQSVELKARFARDRALGGIMFWELGGDDGTLLRAIHRGLGSGRD